MNNDDNNNNKMVITRLLILLCFVLKCLESHGEDRIKIDIGILYSDEDPMAQIAIEHIRRRYEVMGPYHVRDQLINVTSLDSFAIETIVCDRIKEGIHGIIGPTVRRANVPLQSISETFELPQMQTFWNPAMDGNSMQVLNLYPDPAMLAKAIGILVKDMEWKSYVIIYEDDESIERIQEVLKLQRSEADDYPIIIRKLGPGNDQSTLLKEIKAGKETRIIIDCQTDRLMAILLQAQMINMLEGYRSYILTSLDAHTLDFSALRNNQASFTTLRMIPMDKNSVKHMIRDWEYMMNQTGRHMRIHPESVKLSTALLHDALQTFITACIQLSYTRKLTPNPLNCEKRKKSDYGMAIAEYIKFRPLLNGTIGEPLTGPVEFDSFGRRTNFKLQIVELSDGNFKQVKEWSSEQPDQIEHVKRKESKVEYFTELNLNGVVRVAARKGEPYLMVKENNLTRTEEYEGYTVDLIEEIAKILNFNYSFYLVQDNNYGSFSQETKEWNGLIREIIDRKAELAICDLTITYERGRAVDFSMPFMTLGISILYTKATKKPQDLLSFMQPLSVDIWLYMATAYLIISIIIYCAARLTPREWESPHPCDNDPNELENIWTMKNTFWLTLGSLMTQGCDILPKGISTRMITGMWWFFSLIITSSYTANLAAFLTNERMGPTIESAEDLAKQSDIKYGCVSNGATAAFFRDSNFSTYQRLWRTMDQAEPTVFQKSNTDGVRTVKTRKKMYAFFMESSSIEYERERDCELTQVGSWLDTKGYGIAMPINSGYRTAINEAILKLQESGTLRRLKEKWWKQMHGGGQCNETEHSADDSAAELGIDHVGGVFVVLSAGIVLAFLIAIFEFLWNVRKISVDGQMTPLQAFAKELKFAFKVSDSKKGIVKKRDAQI